MPAYITPANFMSVFNCWPWWLSLAPAETVYDDELL